MEHYYYLWLQLFVVLLTISECVFQTEDGFETKLVLEHINDPKNAQELATETLFNAFTKASQENNRNAIKVEEIMSRLSTPLETESRFHLIRIFELMDLDKDGEITNDEYVNHYAEPVASPSRSLEMMHRLSDYDGDGFITKWEQFMALMVDNDEKTSVEELWRIASEAHTSMDADSDNLVSAQEFVGFMVYNVQKSIYEQRE